MVCPSAFRNPARQTRNGLEKEMILAGHSWQNRRGNVTLGRGVCLSRQLDARVGIGTWISACRYGYSVSARYCTVYSKVVMTQYRPQLSIDAHHNLGLGLFVARVERVSNPAICNWRVVPHQPRIHGNTLGNTQFYSQTRYVYRHTLDPRLFR
jgi:hypothetical protein